MEEDFILETEEVNNKKGIKIFLSILKYITIIGVTITITYFCTINFTIKSYLTGSDSTYLSTKLNLVKNKLKDTYIYDLDSKKMIEYAIKGYVAGVGDTYTQYLTESNMKDLLESTSGSYVGIGVYMINNTENNTVTIVGVIEDSVAEKAGLKVGDIISKVDDKEYNGTQLEEVSGAIKGQEGTNVKITIIRDGSQIDYNIKRANIKVKTVGSDMLDGNIARIRVTSFNEGTAKEFLNAYNDLKEKNPKGLIIDLRNNGGGLVDESLKMADYIVAKGNKLLMTTNKSKDERVDKAKQDPIINIPVVLLINENTASASEIFAGALKDNNNVTIVGKNSYGKGVIQSVFSFTDGTGIKVTTDEYFTPNHNVINKVGIKPDIEIDQDEKWKGYANLPYENDLQLQKAVEQFK